MILPDDYIRAVGEAVRAHDGLFVLDCVASGAIWVDMEASGVDEYDDEEDVRHLFDGLREAGLGA